MWQVIAEGTQGSTYVYEIDFPDYAPAGEVFNAACKAHAVTRRERNITEYLDVREGSYAVRLLYPAGEREKLDKLLAKTAEAGLTVTAEDLEWVEGEPLIQGMEPDEWLSAMTAD